MLSGIFDETFMMPILHSNFIMGLESEDLEKWKTDHGGRTVNESLREHAERYIGQPIYNVIRLVNGENTRNLVPRVSLPPFPSKKRDAGNEVDTLVDTEVDTLVTPKGFVLELKGKFCCLVYMGKIYAMPFYLQCKVNNNNRTFALIVRLGERYHSSRVTFQNL